MCCAASIDPTSLLLADGAAGSTWHDAPIIRVADTVVAAFAAASLPPTGQVRVLEIGAGAGATTQRVLARLDPGRTEYWFTDADSRNVQQAEGRIAADRCIAFDVERAPAEQAIPEHSFDLVLAANVLHATADIGAALDHTLQTLAQDGRLLLLEVAPSGDPPGGWIDLVLGLTRGWWRFADPAVRPDYPLLPRAGWVALLELRGLEVETWSLPGHTIALARRRVVRRVHRDTGGPAAERCAALLATIQDLRPEERGLLLLTTGAVGPAVTDPAAAALWGMMRSLRLERPELEVRCIDGLDDEAAERLSVEPEVVFVAGQRLVPVLGIPAKGETAVLAPESWILVTGAFGGLGRFTAEWLVRRGARHLLLTGRTATETDWIAELRAAGASVRLEACDLADPASRAAWIARLPALGGIIHVAGILDDATLAQARAEQFRAVLAPKLDVALELDAAFPDLDFFLLFSSAVGLFGQAGQASHVAASVGLDALATARRRRGRHAVSLGWGLWRDIGSAAHRTTLIRRMAAQGLGVIPNDAAAAVLDWALGTPEGAVAVLPVDRARFLASFADTSPPASTRAWRRPLPRAAPATTSAPTDRAGLADFVANEAASVLGYHPGQPLDRSANLFDIGLDSLMAVELRNRLQTRLPSRTLSSTLLFEHSSVVALAAHLAGETGAVRGARAAAAADAPVAVVGIGCRMPAGGDDPALFWDALAAGRDGIVPLPNRPGAAKRAGYLADVAGFDPTFFGIAPREAIFMDPQHRLTLEVTWEALEDALIPPDQLAGTATGVFLGMCNYDYSQFAAAAEGADGYAGTGGAPSIAAGRIAYHLGLTGPAMVLDTACSSALVAVHLAVQALRSGECSLALAGGVNLALGAGTTTALEQLHMLSPDGALQGVRRRRQRLRARRRLRHGGAEIVVRSGGRWRSRPGGDPGHRGQPGWPQRRPDRTEWSGAAGGDPHRPGERRGVAGSGGLHRSARHRHGTRRSDRDARTGRGVRRPDARAPGGFGEDQYRSYRGHRRHRRLYQGGDDAAPAGGARQPAFPCVEPAYRPRWRADCCPDRADAAPGRICRDQFLRLLRHQYTCCAVARASPIRQQTPGTALGAVPGLAGGPGDSSPPGRQEAPGADARHLLISARTPEALRVLIGRYRVLLDRGVPFADLCHSAAVGRARLPWWICVDNPDALDTAEPSAGPAPVLPPQPGRLVDLPLYPFQRQPYWVPPPRATAPPAPAGTHTLLGRRIRSGLAHIQHEVRLAPDQPGWLADHAIDGRVIVPAAALVEMLLAAAPPSSPVALTGIAFRQMLVPSEQPWVQTVADPANRTLTIFAAADNEKAEFSEIATATWAAAEAAPEQSLEAARVAATRPFDLPTLYDRFATAGLSYGPAFQCLRRLSGGDGLAVADLADSDPSFRLDPRVLDAAWQSLAAALPPDSASALAPVGLDRLVWFGGTPRASLLRLVAPDRADVTLFDDAGRVVAWCEGLRLATVGGTHAVLSETAWQPAPAGDEIPVWLDCRTETDPAAACWRVLEVFRAAGAARLAILVRGATAAGGTVPLAAAAALVGFVATLARERPELRPVLLDLDDSSDPPPVPADCGPLLAWRDGELLTPHLVPRPTPAIPAAPFVLARGAAATLDGLRWAPAPRRSPGPNEVEIEVGSAGLNFRDVMNLLGVYPGDAGAPGAECAGTVVAVGRDVTTLAAGDTVVAITSGCFASHVIADERLVCRLPAALDARVAAAQPVAMLTARLALDEVARLQPGQRVLIHAATGGVGLAAVALARMRGADIVATAGSPAKRARLAALGVREIHDSRSLEFAAAAPVDVVLNSLVGPAIPAGLRLLRPGGCFLELGKAELWSEAQVRAVRADVRYVAIALDQLIADDPARVGGMLRAAIDSLTDGAEPLPVQSYPFAEVTDALRCLQAARHVGKLVLSRTLLRGDASYVITGGTGALGRHLAHWLVARGARQLILLARRAAPVDIPGASVRCIAVDVSDEAAVRQALSAQGQPVKGVFHLAGELHDATAATLTRARLDAALAAKLRGAEALDKATASMPLDQFVLFGSLAGVAGSAGQANYAAANAALDAVVQARRRRGAPALLVDWGAWQGEGMAHGLGGPALTSEAALAAMDAALSASLTRVAISAGSVPAAPGVAALAEQLAGAIGSAKLAVLSDAVDEIVSRILGLGDLALERERPLNELGLDSLMAVELRNALGAACGRTLPTSLVFDYPTAEALGRFLAVEMGLIAATVPVPPPVTPAPRGAACRGLRSGRRRGAPAA